MRRYIDILNEAVMKIDTGDYTGELRGSCRARDYAELTGEQYSRSIGNPRVSLFAFKCSLGIVGPATARRGMRAVDRPEQSIARAVSARRSSIQRLELGQRRLLQSRVSVQVDLGGLDRFVPKPQRDDGAVDSRLQIARDRRCSCAARAVRSVWCRSHTTSSKH
jgi:hypothetical protein